MKQTLRLTLGLLALGFATSVLVAWGLMPFVSPGQFTNAKIILSVENRGKLERWQFSRHWWGFDAQLFRWHDEAQLRSFGQAAKDRFLREENSWMKHIAVRHSDATMQTFIDSPGWDRYAYECVGLPVPCMYRLLKDRVPRTTRKPVIRSSMEQWFPMHPSWRGLLPNTLFYAAIWSVLLVLMPWFVRTRRIGLGLCPSCKYSLAGLDASTCPECGKLSAPREAAA